jgi:inner membrane protein
VQHNLYPVDAVAGDLAARQHERPLAELVSRQPENEPRHYLLGEFYVDVNKVVNVIQIEACYPVLWGRDKIRPYYANGGVRDNLNLTAIRGEVIVQFWPMPGGRAMKLGFNGDSGIVKTPGCWREYSD